MATWESAEMSRSVMELLRGRGSVPCEAGSLLSEYEPAPPGGDQHVLDVVHLVRGGAPHLAHGFQDVVHAVDVALTEQAAVGVDGEPAPPPDVALGDEVTR